MTDSACLIHGFSYASAIPNDSKQGNPMHVLGESISFGRYMDDSLDWEKFSTFSHKKYVEEAERYAKPGSVAQKKAFFEAHYKKIAAQKAAALLDQANKDADNNNNHQLVTLNSHSDVVEEKIEEDHSSAVVGETVKKDENNTSRVSFVETNSNDQFEDTVSMSEGSGIPQIERPLLKNSVASEDIPSVMSKKRSSLSILKSSIQHRTWRVQSTDAKPVVTPHFEKENNVNESTMSSSVNSTDKKRSSPKSLRALINLIPIKEQDKQPILATKKTGTSFKAPKDCSTPLKTPIVVPGKSAGIYPIAATPQSENKRIKTPTDTSANGSKTSGPKWHLLSAVYSKSLTAYRKKLQSPTSTTPFILRTEERASKRKQKLEEKFKAEEVEKVQLQKTLKEKAGNEFRKLGCGFCFKARTLPDFYKEREIPKDQKKTPATSTTQQAVLGRSISNKKHGTVSMPTAPPPPPPTSFTKNGVYKNLSNKNVPKPSKFLSTSLPDKFTHGKASSNIR